MTLTGLFSTLPVRYKAFIKTVKREYARMLSVVQAYGLMAAGVRTSVCQISKQGKSTVFSTQGSTRLLDAITNVFGSQQAAKVQEVDAALVGDEEQPFDGGGKGGTECRVRGLVSNGRDGRSSNDRQYIYINQRPVDMPKLQRVLNDAFRTFSSSPSSASFPFLLLDLQLPTDCYDVNVTPNKRTVLLHEEAGMMAAVRRVLVDVWAPSQQTFTVNNSLDSYMTTVKREMSRTAEQLRATTGDDEFPASLPSLEQVDDDLLGEEQQGALSKRSSVTIQHDVSARRRAVNGLIEVKKEPMSHSSTRQPSFSTSNRSPFSSMLPSTVPSPLKRQKVSHTSTAQIQRAARPALPNAHQPASVGDMRRQQEDGWTITGGRPQSTHPSSSEPHRHQQHHHDCHEEHSSARVKHEIDDDSRLDEEVQLDTPAPPPAPTRTTTGTIRVDIDAITRYWKAKAATHSSTSPTSSSTTAPTPTPLHDRITSTISSSPIPPAQPTDENNSDLGGQPHHSITPVIAIAADTLCQQTRLFGNASSRSVQFRLHHRSSRHFRSVHYRSTRCR